MAICFLTCLLHNKKTAPELISGTAYRQTPDVSGKIVIYRVIKC